jgi:cell division FtsZ-interacting protein ZapD
VDTKGETKMALTEQKVIDKIEVVENGTLQVREATRILKDGDQIAQTYHRWSFAPGSDVSEMPANVQAIAAAAWTEEVIAAYQAQLEANRP